MVNQEIARISGFVDFNGLASESSIVVLMAKKLTEENFQIVVPKISAIDGSLWEFSNLELGQAYEIQAYIDSDGKKTDFTQVKTIVAPAKEIKISISSSFQPSVPNKVSIEGFFDLNGYFPNGSLAVYYSLKGMNQWQLATKGIIKDKGEWFFTNALEGKNYDLQAHLLDSNDKVLFRTEIISVIAPARNEKIRIDSHLLPP